MFTMQALSKLIPQPQSEHSSLLRPLYTVYGSSVLSTPTWESALYWVLVCTSYLQNKEVPSGCPYAVLIWQSHELVPSIHSYYPKLSKNSGHKSETPRVGQEMLLSPLAPSYLCISSREITLNYLLMHLLEQSFWLTSSMEPFEAGEKKTSEVLFQGLYPCADLVPWGHCSPQRKLPWLPSRQAHMGTCTATMLCCRWISLCSQLPPMLPPSSVDECEWGSLDMDLERAERGGNGCVLHIKPWGSGWGTSGILHTFVSHLRGYSYLPPFLHCGVIPGLLLPPHSHRFIPISKPILTKAGSTPVALAPTSSHVLKFWAPE